MEALPPTNTKVPPQTQDLAGGGAVAPVAARGTHHANERCQCLRRTQREPCEAICEPARAWKKKRRRRKRFFVSLPLPSAVRAPFAFSLAFSLCSALLLSRGTLSWPVPLRPFSIKQCSTGFYNWWQPTLGENYPVRTYCSSSSAMAHRNSQRYHITSTSQLESVRRWQLHHFVSAADELTVAA